ncbi:MAG: glycosyltransferase [Candidatus Bathyarchaeota archaeon]|nr:glycosyltransferase [Candidatus Bathyarchaeota archaeon]
MSNPLSMPPKVSVHWLNFNSMHVIETTKQSLTSLATLDYPNYELIIVDIGSSDGSPEVIKNHLQTEPFRRLRVVFVKVNADVGPIDGENAAYRVRDRQAQYIALTHSDVVARPDWLRNLVGYMERHRDAGAVQGIVVKAGSGKVDSSGLMLDEALNLYALHENSSFSLKKPILISFVEATMAVYRMEAIRQAIGEEKDLFVPGAFMNYLEDVLVSILLWSVGYKSIVLPCVTGEHLRMATTGTYVQPIARYHYRLRNQIALLYITNSADKLRFTLQVFRRAIVGRGSFAFRQMMLRSVIEGLIWGHRLKRLYGTINLYETPMRKTSIMGRLHP